MIGQETHDIERKITANLKILSDSAEPLGGRTISRRPREQSVNLSERAVRYHLKLVDERGLTYCECQQDGRSITQPGLDELRSALVCDKVGFVFSRIDLLAYLAALDLNRRSGYIPIDVSLLSRNEFSMAMDIMKRVFIAGLSVIDLVSVAAEGERLGDVVVPQDKVGFATVACAFINGVFLKAGIPITFRFGGLLQMRNREPLRFVDLIEYNGSTLDPFEIFIAGKMTEVDGVSQHGTGKILASLYEIPMPSIPAALEIIDKLKETELYN